MLTLQDCRRAYERLSSEAQHSVKEICSQSSALRTHAKAIQQIIYCFSNEEACQCPSVLAGTSLIYLLIQGLKLI